MHRLTTGIWDANELAQLDGFPNIILQWINERQQQRPDLVVAAIKIVAICSRAFRIPFQEAGAVEFLTSFRETPHCPDNAKPIIDEALSYLLLAEGESVSQNLQLANVHVSTLASDTLGLSTIAPQASSGAPGPFSHTGPDTMLDQTTVNNTQQFGLETIEEKPKVDDHVYLVESDNALLFEHSVQIKFGDIKVISSALQDLQVGPIMDFPPAVFLQRPAVLEALLHVLETYILHADVVHATLGTLHAWLERLLAVNPDCKGKFKPEQFHEIVVALLRVVKPSLRVGYGLVYRCLKAVFKLCTPENSASSDSPADITHWPSIQLDLYIEFLVKGFDEHFRPSPAQLANGEDDLIWNADRAMFAHIFLLFLGMSDETFSSLRMNIQLGAICEKLLFDPDSPITRPDQHKLSYVLSVLDGEKSLAFEKFCRMERAANVHPRTITNVAASPMVSAPPDLSDYDTLEEQIYLLMLPDTHPWYPHHLFDIAKASYDTESFAFANNSTFLEENLPEEFASKRRAICAHMIGCPREVVRRRLLDVLRDLPNGFSDLREDTNFMSAALRSGLQDSDLYIQSPLAELFLPELEPSTPISQVRRLYSNSSACRRNAANILWHQIASNGIDQYFSNEGIDINFVVDPLVCSPRPRNPYSYRPFTNHQKPDLQHFLECAMNDGLSPSLRNRSLEDLKEFVTGDPEWSSRVLDEHECIFPAVIQGESNLEFLSCYYTVATCVMMALPESSVLRQGLLEDAMENIPSLIAWCFASNVNLRNTVLDFLATVVFDRSHFPGLVVDGFISTGPPTSRELTLPLPREVLERYDLLMGGGADWYTPVSQFWSRAPGMDTIMLCQRATVSRLSIVSNEALWKAAGKGAQRDVPTYIRALEGWLTPRFSEWLLSNLDDSGFMIVVNSLAQMPPVRQAWLINSERKSTADHIPSVVKHLRCVLSCLPENVDSCELAFTRILDIVKGVLFPQIHMLLEPPITSAKNLIMASPLAQRFLCEAFQLLAVLFSRPEIPISDMCNGLNWSEALMLVFDLPCHRVSRSALRVFWSMLSRFSAYDKYHEQFLHEDFKQVLISRLNSTGCTTSHVKKYDTRICLRALCLLQSYETTISKVDKNSWARLEQLDMAVNRWFEDCNSDVAAFAWRFCRNLLPTLDDKTIINLGKSQEKDLKHRCRVALRLLPGLAQDHVHTLLQVEACEYLTEVVKRFDVKTTDIADAVLSQGFLSQSLGEFLVDDEVDIRCAGLRLLDALFEKVRDQLGPLMMQLNLWARVVQSATRDSCPNAVGASACVLTTTMVRLVARVIGTDQQMFGYFLQMTSFLDIWRNVLSSISTLQKGSDETRAWLLRVQTWSLTQFASATSTYFRGEQVAPGPCEKAERFWSSDEVSSFLLKAITSDVPDNSSRGVFVVSRLAALKFNVSNPHKLTRELCNLLLTESRIGGSLVRLQHALSNSLRAWDVSDVAIDCRLHVFFAERVARLIQGVPPPLPGDVYEKLVGVLQPFSILASEQPGACTEPLDKHKNGLVVFVVQRLWRHCELLDGLCMYISTT